MRAAGHRRPVTTGFADYRRRFTRYRRLVHRSYTLDHFAIGGDVVAGLDQDDVTHLQAGAGNQTIVLAGTFQQFCLALGAGLLQRQSLRLAAAFGNGLGEIGEQHGEPQPQDDLEREGEVLAAGHQIAQEYHGRERGHDFDHEHHGVLHHQPRIEFCKGRPDCRQHDARIEHRRRRRLFLQFHGFHGRNS
ncbi:hypothetical protein V1278_002233 [Bradyrhizobium sp. AZCC 1577]